MYIYIYIYIFIVHIYILQMATAVNFEYAFNTHTVLAFILCCCSELDTGGRQGDKHRRKCHCVLHSILVRQHSLGSLYFFFYMLLDFYFKLLGIT